MKYFNFFFVCLLFFSGAELQAQQTNSPFSRLGFGEINPALTISSQGMGGLGVSFSSLNSINMINPALLSRHRYTAFEGSAGVEYKRLKASDLTQQDFRGNLRQLDFVFPIAKGVSVGAGLQPFSAVNYSAVTYEFLETTPTWVKYSYSGTGGMSQTYAAIGYSPIKNIAIGGRVNYNFGASSHIAESNLDDGTAQYIVGTIERYTYADFSYQVGAHISIPLTKDKKKNTSLNIGGTYDFAQDLNMTRFQALQRKTGFGTLLDTDTIAQNETGSHFLPERLKFGIALQKSLSYTIAFEASQQAWSQATGNTRMDGLTDSRMYGLGFEWIPDVNSVTNYLKRVAYRTGFRYEETPWMLQNEQVQDYSFSFGASFPVGRLFSSLNTAVVIGQRATPQSDLLSERYIRLSLGAMINGRWFVKRRYD